MGGGGPIYTKDFKEFKKSHKITLVISILALILSIIALLK